MTIIAHSAPETSHIETVTAHTVSVTSHMDASIFHVDALMYHMQDALNKKSQFNPLSNLSRSPMKNGEAIFRKGGYSLGSTKIIKSLTTVSETG